MPFLGKPYKVPGAVERVPVFHDVADEFLGSGGGVVEVAGIGFGDVVLVEAVQAFADAAAREGEDETGGGVAAGEVVVGV